MHLLRHYNRALAAAAAASSKLKCAAKTGMLYLLLHATEKKETRHFKNEKNLAQNNEYVLRKTALICYFLTNFSAKVSGTLSAKNSDLPSVICVSRFWKKRLENL